MCTPFNGDKSNLCVEMVKVQSKLADAGNARRRVVDTRIRELQTRIVEEWCADGSC